MAICCAWPYLCCAKLCNGCFCCAKLCNAMMACYAKLCNAMVWPMMTCCVKLGNAMVTLLIILLLIVLFPLLLIEIILLVICGIKCLPPLSCMLSKPELEGKFDESKMEPHPPVPEPLLAKTDNIAFSGMKWYRAVGSPEEAVRTLCEIMLAYNTVATTLDCPSDLQGVFWMDGNKIPEELCCLSYADCDRDANGTYKLNKVNGNASWTYLNSGIGKFIARFQEAGEVAGMLVFQFKSADLKDGRIWSCKSFDYQDTNWLTSLGKWSMERLDGPGVNFKRGCYWLHAAFGDRLEFGSYTLRKIMHTDKSPVQPAYDEFVAYMAKKKGVSQITEAAE